MAKNKPVFSCRAGKIQAAIFEHKREMTNPPGQTVISYSTNIVKSYYDEEAKIWKETTSFFVDELPKVELVARRCYGFIVLKTENGEG